MQLRFKKGISRLIIIILSTSATASFLISDKTPLEPEAKNLFEKISQKTTILKMTFYL